MDCRSLPVVLCVGARLPHHCFERERATSVCFSLLSVTVYLNCYECVVSTRAKLFATATGVIGSLINIYVHDNHSTTRGVDGLNVHTSAAETGCLTAAEAVHTGAAEAGSEAAHCGCFPLLRLGNGLLKWDDALLRLS